MQAIIKHDALPFAAATIFKSDRLILHLQSGGSHTSAPGLVFCFHSSHLSASIYYMISKELLNIILEPLLTFIFIHL